MTFLAKNLILPLPRPEYVAYPEGFISALAWSAFDVTVSNPPSGKKVGYRYKGVGVDEQPKALEIRYTFPTGERLAAFGQALQDTGINTLSEGSSSIGRAFAKSVEGLTTTKGKFIPASPLSPALALLQDGRGIQGKANPANVAEILETMWRLGGGPSKENRSVAEMWLDATRLKLASDPVLSRVDAAVSKTVLQGSQVAKTKGQASMPDEYHSVMAKSPYTWFVSAWTRITQAEWVSNLPAKVWADWATAILRLAFGFGYIFESKYYVSLGRALLGDTAPTLADVTSQIEHCVVWKPRTSPSEIRDTSSPLIRSVVHAVAVRDLVSTWIAQNSAQEEPVDEALRAMHLDTEFTTKLASIFHSDSRSSSANNLWEAIKYPLKSRENDGSQNADYYGVLRASGSRFLFVDPGTEWIAVIASICSDKPKQSIALGNVMDAFHELGLRPDRIELLNLLERAGLARGSADADDGVRVSTAF